MLIRLKRGTIANVPPPKKRFRTGLKLRRLRRHRFWKRAEIKIKKRDSPYPPIKSFSKSALLSCNLAKNIDKFNFSSLLPRGHNL